MNNGNIYKQVSLFYEGNEVHRCMGYQIVRKQVQTIMQHLSDFHSFHLRNELYRRV
jgi:hypothetical protein